MGPIAAAAGLSLANAVHIEFALDTVIYPDSTPGTDSDNPRVQYHYDNTSFPYALTSITDERGVTYATWTYNSSGRVATSEHVGPVEHYAFSYDDVNYQTTVNNPLSKNTVYHFNRNVPDLARLTQIEGIVSANCAASNTLLSYDSNGFVNQTTDGEGRVTSIVNNPRGLPTSITRGFGTASAATTTYTWDSALRVPTQIVEPGRTTDLTWSSGRLTQLMQTDTTTTTVPYSTNGQTRTWTFTYTTGGLLASVDGPLSGAGDTVSYSYNSSGFIQTITDEIGHVIQVTAWNSRGQPTAITDLNGVALSLGYDERGRFTAMTIDPSGLAAQTSIQYSAAGDVTKITRPNGAYLQYTYDDARRLTKMQDNSGASVEYDRDNLGNATARRIRDSGGALLLSQTATYDELGRLLKFIGAASQTWTSAYDKTDNRVAVTDPRSNLYGWAFDSLNRLISETDENHGVVTNLSYDNAGRLLSKQYPAAPSENIAYTWDVTAGGNKGVGRLTRIDDASGAVEWTYNALGQVTQEKKTTGSVVYTIGYTYDLDGNVTQIAYPSGHIINYSRGATGLITGVTGQASSGGATITLASSVAYAPFGPLTSLTYGNGLVLSKTYTQDYLIETLQVQDPSTLAFILDRAHAFGDGINLTNVANNTAETVPTVAAASNSYSYPGGNNKLATVMQGASTVRAFAYDGAGNVTADTRGGTVYNYRTNNRNRLDRLTIGSTITADYTYDGLERLAIRTTQNMSPSGTTHYLYDRAGHLLAEADSSGQTLREYIWLDDLPLAVVSDVNTTSPNLYYVHADHLDRPIKMTDVSKNVVWNAIYLPFGAVLSIAGAAANNLRFPGQYFLIESGLHYNWYRHYDPTLGRYVQPDLSRDMSPALSIGEIGFSRSPTSATLSSQLVEVGAVGLPQEITEFVDGPNIYAYAKSNPQENIDSSGQQTGAAVVRGGAWLCSRYPSLCAGAAAAAIQVWNYCRKTASGFGGGGGGDDDYRRCFRAANGSSDDWDDFCRSLSRGVNKVIGGQTMKRACWEKTYEPRMSKRNWCENQFGTGE